MKIENLKIFLEVAQSESINEAARNLFMSHQNLNKIIKNLEIELNTQLFIRSSKGIQLTINGKELFVTASQIVKNYDAFLEKIQITDGNIIKFYTLPSQSTLVNQLQGIRFGEQYLSVHKRDFGEIIKMIERGKSGIFFLPISGEKVQLAPEVKQYDIVSSDLITFICHKSQIDYYTGKKYLNIDKLISNTSKNNLVTHALNIDDIQTCKKLMRDEGFAYSTEYQMYCAEFPEDEWIIFHQESDPEYQVTYTLFFNLPNTAALQQLQQSVIDTVKSFFSIQKHQSTDAT